MKLTQMLMWGGAVATAGSFGYKMIQKSRGKEVNPIADTVMYGGLGALSVGVALNFATGKKAPIKIS